MAMLNTPDLRLPLVDELFNGVRISKQIMLCFDHEQPVTNARLIGTQVQFFKIE